MRTALFTNFTDQEFTGYWDGKPKTFKPGESVYMPDYLAAHFAKHLVNRELLRTDSSGNLIYKDGDKFTSPKHPEQVPVFKQLFDRACRLDGEDMLGDKKDDVNALIDAANKNRQEPAEPKSTQAQDPTQPQIVLSPDFDQEEDDAEDGFEGKPKE